VRLLKRERKGGALPRGASFTEISKKGGIVYEKNEICKAVDCRLVQCSSLLMERKRASESFFDFERG